MPSRKIGYRQLALTASLLLAGTPASAVFCVVDPIVPPCCPTPCPVFDAIRVPKLLADVTSLKQAIEADTQIVQSAKQLGQTIGDTKTTLLAARKQLSAFPATISGEITAIQKDLPTNPVAALGTLKQSLFETGIAGQGSASQSATRRTSRIEAAQQEQAAALAVSLVKSESLPSSSALQGQLASTASGSDQLHGDFAANSTARLALYQDLGGLHQLAAAWLSHRASQSAVTHPTTAGGTLPQPMTPVAGTSSQNAGTGQSPQSTVDQLVSLHNERVAAQTLLIAYPALQQTIDSAALANQFISTAEDTLRQSLSAQGAGSIIGLSDVEKALLSADAGGWLDAGKEAQEQQATAQVLKALVAGGALSPSVLLDGSSAGQQIQQAMSSWLEAKKQGQYWAQLAQSAQKSMASLDHSLGDLSDQAGIDLTGTSAAAAEVALLNKLQQDPAASQWQALIAAATQDAGARSVLQRGATP